MEACCTKIIKVPYYIGGDFMSEEEKDTLLALTQKLKEDWNSRCGDCHRH